MNSFPRWWKATLGLVVLGNENLARFNRAAAGHELRIIELKKHVNDLSCRLGQRVPYRPGFSATPPAPETPPPAQS